MSARQDSSQRDAFPAFSAIPPPFHYLDNAAMTQILGPALDACVRHEISCRANTRRSIHFLAEAATDACEHARASIARYLGVEAREIILTGGATASINILAQAIGRTLGPGDTILLSRAEHHSNLVPWYMLGERCGTRLRVAPVDDRGCLDPDGFLRLLDGSVRLVTLPHVSSVTGDCPPVAELAAAARRAGALVALDGAQRVAGGPLDLPALGIDFYSFSGHKMFAPTGIGVLWGRYPLLGRLPPVLGGGGMIASVTPEQVAWADPPARFEAGTPPVAQAVGLGAAAEWLMARDDHAAVREGLRRLTLDLADALEALSPAIRLVGPRNGESPILSLAVSGAHPHDLCQIASQDRVCLRGGLLCAEPLIRAIAPGGLTRISLARYNDACDTGACVRAIGRALRVLGIS